MFERTKMFFEECKLLLSKPISFVNNANAYVPKPREDDYWVFEMVTNEWINNHGETVPVKHTCIIEPHEGTWMEILDKVIDEMEKHYGYDIKEQVYYSVTFPLNDPECAGYTRCLNDAVLQKLLLAYPDAYDWQGHKEFKL